MKIATDGSCLKNPGGKTGWAWVAENGQWQSGSVPEGSNNIGELMAAIAALRATKKIAEVHLEIDSQYVLNIVKKWGAAWKRKGWKKANGEPVANAKLVEKLLLLSDRPGLTMEWVKGHNGHWLNEFADEQAGLAARNQTPPSKGRYTQEEITAQKLADTKPRRNAKTRNGAYAGSIKDQQDPKNKSTVRKTASNSPKTNNPAPANKLPKPKPLKPSKNGTKMGVDPSIEALADELLADNPEEQSEADRLEALLLASEEAERSKPKGKNKNNLKIAKGSKRVEKDKKRKALSANQDPKSAKAYTKN